MSDALMRKTKQQLVDIILRKDEVHKSLNDSLNEIHKELVDKDGCNDKLKERVKQLVEENNNLNTRLNAYIDHIDKLAYDKKGLIKELEEATIKSDGLIEACDEYASKVQEQIEDIKHYKRLSILTSSVTIIVLLILLLSL